MARKILTEEDAQAAVLGGCVLGDVYKRQGLYPGGGETNPVVEAMQG